MAWIAIDAAAVIALVVLDFWLDRFIARMLFRLIEHLPSYRPGGRYRSQSTPEKYAALGKPRNEANHHSR